MFSRQVWGLDCERPLLLSETLATWIGPVYEWLSFQECKLAPTRTTIQHKIYVRAYMHSPQRCVGAIMGPSSRWPEWAHEGCRARHPRAKQPIPKRRGDAHGRAWPHHATVEWPPTARRAHKREARRRGGWRCGDPWMAKSARPPSKAKGRYKRCRRSREVAPLSQRDGHRRSATGDAYAAALFASCGAPDQSRPKRSTPHACDLLRGKEPSHRTACNGIP